jgi:Tfp pilus assembly protein PilO
VSLSARDKKILMVVVPVAVLAAFWLLLLSPRRAESARLGEQLSAVEQKRDTAVAKANQLQGARNTYADDYATVVRLGKAVPSSLDMPSLLVQLESAAKGTGIDFDSVKAGARTDATTSSTVTSTTAGGTDSAKTGPGKTAEKAQDAKTSADQGAAAASATSTTTNTGTTGFSTGAAAAPGLDSVPLTFTFNGSFFQLADFLHRTKRFVRVVNNKISVKGRLMTIDSLAFKSTAFPTIEASITATVYLSPKAEGVTGGATPAGPRSTSNTVAPTSAPSPTPSAPSASAPAGGSQ